MKKVILGAFVVGGLFACNKAEVGNTTLSSDDMITTPTKAGSGNHGQFWQDNHTQPGVLGVTYGCFQGVETCGAKRVIAPNHIGLIDDLLIAGSNSVDIFAENDATLSTYFGAPIVLGVINGSITFYTKGDIETELYFVFSEGSEVIQAIPLSK